jgi:hypothetical protein
MFILGILLMLLSLVCAVFMIDAATKCKHIIAGLFFVLFVLLLGGGELLFARSLFY